MARKRILLVDDSETSLMMARMILSKANYEILVAKDGQAGVETAAREKPDLVLLDVVMPRMNGFEACAALKAQPETQGIPVIMVTTRGEGESVESGFSAGASDYVTKPVNGLELLPKSAARWGTDMTPKTEHDSLESYVRRVQADTHRYVHDLLDENGKLRVAAATLQLEKARLEEELLATRESVNRHKLEEVKLERRLAEIAAENRRYVEEYVLVEQQNTALANLYVASVRLHSSLQREEILAVIIDIIEFLVGCEEVAVFEVKDGRLAVATSKGAEALAGAEIALGEGPIGRTALTGQPYLPVAPGVDDDGITACFPVKFRDSVAYVITLFKLLPQKSGRLQPINHDLLNLLAAEAGTALASASILSDSSARAR